MIKRPSVSLVGAGPGDPGLVTARALRRLAAADVVVYDRRVDPRLLQSARPDAERIDVGPAPATALAQDAVSLLLVEKAREGKAVVRLVPGDPLVFESGGREALFLREQGVPFEIVPGIPPALGVPGHAGIPITYPGAGDAVVLVRADEADGGPRLDWARLAGMKGTLVAWAGRDQLPAIVRGLLAHGRPPDEPAAVVLGGTTPRQRTLSGTLEELARRLREEPPKEPAVLIVGTVVALRDHLRWFDERPLFGRRIVVTRAREQARELSDLLEDLGAEAIEVPVIRVAPLERVEALDQAVAEAGRYDWIVFTSVNGVEAFMQRLLAGPGDVRALGRARLCAIGPATAARIARFGLKVALTPTEYRAEAIVSALRAAGEIAGRRFLLARADIAREALADELRRAGALVTEVAAYRTIEEPPTDAPDVYRLLLDRQIDAVTFTSASTVRAFVRLLGEEPAPDLLAGTVVAAIGPVTAEAAARLGIRVDVVPPTYTMPALVEALVARFAAQPVPP
ncbi:MAG TPA: uroporphyrinogen-III C-methyltransferase [Vicinamibacterales bacterium]|nr:uroporphyrinogen-III C-methyltransferase [Vicinamibacterales bacterium]